MHGSEPRQPLCWAQRGGGGKGRAVLETLCNLAAVSKFHVQCHEISTFREVYNNKKYIFILFVKNTNGKV